MQLTDGKKIGREIGMSFRGIVRAMLMDAALLMEIPLTILEVLMGFCDLW
jgi:tetrahydromethanopterin S-methyltransferase subunit G